jgi:hypothetical protein
MMKSGIFGLAVMAIVTVFTTPASALCNEICRAKCKLYWNQEIGSYNQCLAVWSVRNGPSGRGCGAPGASFQRCQ